MSDSVRLVVVDDIARAYDFGSSHPLRPERVLLTYENVRTLGFIDLPQVQEVAARVATDAEIEAVHAPDFVATVKGIDAGDIAEREGLQFGLGTPDDPIFDGMHAASAAVCGASLVAAEVVATGDANHSFNPAGGLHHARRDEASGFCIYNDPAVAIAKILELQPDWRVMYVDVDVHHGDGVQWIFYDEPRVLTLSLHQSGRYLYPGTGFEDEIGTSEARGTSANIPLLPYTSGDDYLRALEGTLMPLAEAFRPHVLVTQLGADTHWGDPLANLGLTMPAYPRMAKLLHDAAREFAEGRWVATGGGGYQFDTVVPKVWTIHFAEMCGVSDRIPAEWLEDKDPDEVSRRYPGEVESSIKRVLQQCLPRISELVASVTEFHRFVAYLIPSGFLLLSLWTIGVVVTNRGPGEWFWRVLAVLQVIVGIQVIAGVILLISGEWPLNWRHFIYGAVMPLLLLFVAHRLASGRSVAGFGADRFKDVPWAVFGIASFIAAAATFMAYLTGPA